MTLIVQVKKLSHKEFSEIEKLVSICFNEDIGSLTIGVNPKCSTHYYIMVENKIVSYLELYRSRIFNLCTHPDFRNRGYAKQLIQHVIENSKLQDLYLYCGKDNIVAKNLYSSFGFQNLIEYKEDNFMIRTTEKKILLLLQKKLENCIINFFP